MARTQDLGKEAMKPKGNKAMLDKKAKSFKAGDDDQAQDDSIATLETDAKQMEEAYDDDNRTPTGVAVAAQTDDFEGHHTMDEGVDVNRERIDPGHIRNASHEKAGDLKADEPKSTSKH